MAALSDLHVPQVVELRQLRVDDLNPVLAEEASVWRQTFDWDFTPSAELVRRFVGMQALNGFSLVIDGRPVGYTYYVCEERKGLIGDLYLLRDFSTAGNTARLLSAILDALMKTPYVRRIESQLILLRSNAARSLASRRFLDAHDRNFMEIDLSDPDRFASTRGDFSLDFETWSERRQEDAARLIAAAYRGHIDSSINDQYCSIPGARRFLSNIVQYPGCGRFFAPSSYMAVDPDSGGLAGLVLCSLIAEDIGHVTQLCVLPSLRGAGNGRELMKCALRSLALHGCRKASLTVTVANQDANRLYEQMGFRLVRTFAAYVWEGF